MNIKRLPNHMKQFYGTLRYFKQVKRRQARNLQNSVDALQTGSAYSPILRDVDELSRIVARIRHKLSVKYWGR